MANTLDSIGHYQVIDTLAQDASVRIYRVQDHSGNGTPAVLKLMYATPLTSPAEQHVFLQAARRLQALTHPAILPLLDCSIEDNIPYIVMQYAPNGSLYDRLKHIEPRALAAQEALSILARIASALAYAHQQGIIHRGLKPANILFDAHGDALLADFGIAPILETSIKYGSAISTSYYMAPEQFRGTISTAADQYALACIAYQMLTGRLPFNAHNFMTLGLKHLSEEPIPPTQLNILLSRSLETPLLRAMAKDSTQRFPDITTFMTTLGLSPVPASSTPSSAAPAAPLTPPTVVFPSQQQIENVAI